MWPFCCVLFYYAYVKLQELLSGFASRERRWRKKRRRLFAVFGSAMFMNIPASSSLDARLKLCFMFCHHSFVLLLRSFIIMRPPFFCGSLSIAVPPWCITLKCDTTRSDGFGTGRRCPHTKKKTLRTWEGKKVSAQKTTTLCDEHTKGVWSNFYSDATTSPLLVTEV